MHIIKRSTAVLMLALLPYLGGLASHAASGGASGASMETPVSAITPGPNSGARAIENSGGGIMVARDIRYVPEVKQCTADLYVPKDYFKSNATFPTIMVVHGGAWVLGSKLDPGEVDIAHRLAENGYVVFNINYRLAQEGGIYPKAVQDTRDALAYMTSHAGDLKIDISRIGLFGGSAGALLALLTAYVPQGDVAEFKPAHYPTVTLPKPRAVVTYGGISDIRNMEVPWVMKFMDDTPWHGTGAYDQASPITYIKTAVPTLCVHGSNDVTVPIEQSKNLVAALQAQGIKTDMIVIPKSRHVFHEEPGPNRERAFGKLLEFFNANVKQ